MKRLVLLAALGASGGAMALQLGLTPNGVKVACAAPKCEATLQWPKMTGGGERGPKVLALSDAKATLEYPGGAKWSVALDGDGTIRMAPVGARNAKDSGISHSLQLPVSLKDGSFFALDGGERRPFPSEKGADPFLFKGDNKTLEVSDAEGRGFAFAIPYGWAQLQDNRHWNNGQSFLYKTYSGLPGDAGYGYVFSVKPLKGDAVSLAKAASLDPHAYVPYPEAKEELWPGKGPIRTFGWQEGVRQGYARRRVQDANAVFFVGDSLTENWRTIAKDLAPVKVANRGVGGDTSRGCLFRFPHEVVAHQPAAVVIAVGTNDLTAHGNPEDCIWNVREMVRLCRAYSGKMPVVVCTVPACSNPKAPLRPGSLDALNALIRKLCADEKCILVDRYAMSLGADGKQDLSLYGPDRLHFGARGYVKWAAEMRKVLTDRFLGGEKYTPREKLDLTGYEIVWRDEFDGDRVDEAKWQSPAQRRQGASVWDPKYVSVKDGKAVFRIERTSDPTWRYKSACLRTARSYDPKDRLFEFTYGYVEARVKVHHWLRGDYWFAVWMMDGSVSDANPDTRRGCEIDVMETFHMNNLGQMPHTLHWNGYGRKHNSASSTTWPNLLLMNGDFHTYGVLWTPEFLAFTIDGYVTWKTDMKGLGSDKDGKTKSLGVPQAPAYIKLSVEAAPWAGPWWQWEREMPESDSCEVDWVRVWQRK